jgi:hypothetical protein
MINDGKSINCLILNLLKQYVKLKRKYSISITKSAELEYIIIFLVFTINELWIFFVFIIFLLLNNILNLDT